MGKRDRSRLKDEIRRLVWKVLLLQHNSRQVGNALRRVRVRERIGNPHQRDNNEVMRADGLTQAMMEVRGEKNGTKGETEGNAHGG